METSVPPSPSRPPAAISPRFTLELEFVLALSNPYYLQHLAQTYPHLLNPSTSSDAFAAYLAYLYDYWRTPQYSKYLTHPGAVLRNLELLQQERFRRDVIRPDLLASLLDVNGKIAEADTGRVDGTGQEQDGGEDKGDAERMDEAAG